MRPDGSSIHRCALALGVLLSGAICCAACGGSTDPPGPDPSALDAGTEADAAPDVATSANLPFGRCCGKPEDCASKKCVAVADGPYYCTQTCQSYPDDCPVGFRCENEVTTCIPTAVSSYGCDP